MYNMLFPAARKCALKHPIKIGKKNCTNNNLIKKYDRSLRLKKKSRSIATSPLTWKTAKTFWLQEVDHENWSTESMDRSFYVR